jgi:hypothetical protein
VASAWPRQSQAHPFQPWHDFVAEVRKLLHVVHEGQCATCKTGRRYPRELARDGIRVPDEREGSTEVEAIAVSGSGCRRKLRGATLASASSIARWSTLT